LRKELSRITSKVELLDKYIGLADVVQTGDNYKKVFEVFEKLCLEKELKRIEQHLTA